MSKPNAARDRFADDLIRLTGPIATETRLGVALSGGPDSLALLLLCHAAFPDQCLAATVDHGLRPESADEARHCASVCAALGVPHTILVPPTPITGSVQAAARTARYQLLEQWAQAQGIAHILTGHHADDQAETLAMRLNRGAGLAGLAGVRAVNGRVVRPLLGWRRSELADVAAESGLDVITDPSNTNDRFDRARLRKAMADADWLYPSAMARSAAALADSHAALEWVAVRLAADRMQPLDDGVFLASPDDLPLELQRRLLLIAIARLDPNCGPRGPETMRLIGQLAAGGKASMGAVSCESRADGWFFSPAPPRSSRG